MNTKVFNASLKEKLENLNQKTRPLPDIPRNDDRGLGVEMDRSACKIQFNFFVNNKY